MFTRQNQQTLKMFVDVPETIHSWFLDTNVWGSIAESTETKVSFVELMVNTNNLACLTVYSLFELSRASKIVPALDDLFFQLRHNIWIPLLYDFVYEAELSAYPHGIQMRWMPVSMLTGEEPDGPSVMSQFADDSKFGEARDKHLAFGHGEFMSLEQFKRNFPPQDPTGYSQKDALEFAKLNALDYFRRHDTAFLRGLSQPLHEFDPTGIPSQFMRSVFLFYKFYMHDKSPNKSDFLDFANISYLPYVSHYVTERDVLNTINHIKSTTALLEDVSTIHVSDFLLAFRGAK